MPNFILDKKTRQEVIIIVAFYFIMRRPKMSVVFFVSLKIESNDLETRALKTT